jgi:hypothetical protein
MSANRQKRLLFVWETEASILQDEQDLLDKVMKIWMSNQIAVRVSELD